MKEIAKKIRRHKFPEGHKIWLGKHHTERTKEKISKALKERPTWNKGKCLSKEHKRKLSEVKKGNKNALGLKHTKETRKKMSEAHRGEKCWRWKGGITAENHKIRNGIKFRLWREAVFKRDNWTCQKCGERNGNHGAHHIKSFAIYPKLRFDVNNGITLCEKCHQEIHTKN